MIRHYLKVAFRNLWKYKSQTLISVIGLAVGFVCFALAVLWIRYEMSYDDFHRDAERIYIVRSERPGGVTADYSNINNITPYPLAMYLQETYPEVEEACNYMSGVSKDILIVDDVEYEACHIMADSSFMRFFGVKLIAGNMNFTNPKSDDIAVTPEQARELFGDDDPLGKTLTTYGSKKTVGAVVTGWSKHSNIPFGVVMANWPVKYWNGSAWQTFIRLKENIDVKAFAKKLYETKIEKDGAIFEKIIITPITSLRYDHPLGEIEVRYSYIIFFVVTGALVVICSLFNTLTLYTTRFRIREHEFALRTVFGATKRKIMALLSVEFLMTLAISFLVAWYLIQLILPYFREMSNVSTPMSSIGVELGIYAAFITLVSFVAYAILLTLFRRRTLQTSLRKKGNFSHKTSITFQLIVSIMFIFCSAVMIKQIYFIRNTDLGFDFSNTANILTTPHHSEHKMLGDKLRAIPEITEVIYGSHPLMPNKLTPSTITVAEYDGVKVEKEKQKEMKMDVFDISKSKMDFYSLRLLEGEMPTDESPEAGKVWINEAAARMFGWNKSVGKTINSSFVVAGVIQDVYNLLPTVPVRPMIAGDMNKIMNFPYMDFSSHGYIIKYRAGMWKSCRSKIEAILKEAYPNMPPKIENAEEEYATYVKSETSMITLLSFVSLVCVVISIFGLVSMISLSCERRRKEIAIRKIHGATITDILNIYIREYSLLLIAGAFVAFPAGYLVMRRWIEQYVKQTDISAWIYVSIILLLIMVIVVCVGGKVYRTSRETPAEAVKN